MTNTPINAETIVVAASVEGTADGAVITFASPAERDAWLDATYGPVVAD